MNKLFKMLLSSVIVSKGLFAKTATVPWGTGNVENPYLIASLENLYWIANKVNNSSNTFSGKYLKQTTNINESSTSSWDDRNGGSGPLSEILYGVFSAHTMIRCISSVAFISAVGQQIIKGCLVKYSPGRGTTSNDSCEVA